MPETKIEIDAGKVLLQLFGMEWVHMNALQLAGTKIADARILKRMSQEQLSRIVGCTRNTIDNIERGSEPRARLAIKIADTLGIAVRDLWGESE